MTRTQVHRIADIVFDDGRVLERQYVATAPTPDALRAMEQTSIVQRLGAWSGHSTFVLRKPSDGVDEVLVFSVDR